MLPRCTVGDASREKASVDRSAMGVAGPPAALERIGRCHAADYAATSKFAQFNAAKTVSRSPSNGINATYRVLFSNSVEALYVCEEY